MAIEKYLDQTGLNYYHGRLKTVFADKGQFDSLKNTVDGIVAEGGEPNVIETVKVNNTALTPDANKAVNIDLSDYAETTDLPTNTSDLTNDGDGTSNFATESYVQTNGGKINKIKVNNVEQTIDTTDKSVNIDLSSYALASSIPTKTSDLTNDSTFQTASEVTSAINTAIAGVTQFDYEIVQSLPATGEKGVIYLVSNSGSSPNIYDEYIWLTNSFEKIGTTEIDLSQYWAKADLVAITTAEIDTIIGA